MPTVSGFLSQNPILNSPYASFIIVLAKFSVLTKIDSASEISFRLKEYSNRPISIKSLID
ncbi:hypothetical protein AS4_18660 [Acinetobacter guillouiae]|nr:hypothetical protein AS4_18660 [Acinetobacter guillouiae]